MSNGTEKYGMGSITSADMEKCELLRRPCNIVCVGGDRSWLNVAQPLDVPLSCHVVVPYTSFLLDPLFL